MSNSQLLSRHAPLSHAHAVCSISVSTHLGFELAAGVNYGHELSALGEFGGLCQQIRRRPHSDKCISTGRHPISGKKHALRASIRTLRA